MTAAIMVIAGCQTPRDPVRSDAVPGEGSSIQRIRISAITEFVPNPAASGGTQVKTLVDLFNALGSPVKAPCVLRFELYEFCPVSSDPRGPRLLLWPDRNLNDPDANDEHWKEFLRGYEFMLPLDFLPRQGSKYILEATCLVNQRRYHDLFKMQYQP